MFVLSKTGLLNSPHSFLFKTSGQTKIVLGFFSDGIRILDLIRERRRIARALKNNVRRSAGQFCSVLAQKAADQRQTLKWSTRNIPRHPEAIRMPQPRLAVVVLKCFSRKDILAIGCSFHRAFAVIPCIDDQRSFDSDRLVFVLSIKHQPSAESSGRCRIRLMENSVGPYGDHLPRNFEFWFLRPKNRKLAGRQQRTSCLHHGETQRQQQKTGARIDK